MALSAEAKDRISADVIEWERRVTELQKALVDAQAKLTWYKEIEAEITK